MANPTETPALTVAAQERADALANIRGAGNGNGRRVRAMVDALIAAGDSELAEARAERAARESALAWGSSADALHVDRVRFVRAFHLRLRHGGDRG